jgi:hypothetical protein
VSTIYLSVISSALLQTILCCLVLLLVRNSTVFLNVLKLRPLVLIKDTIKMKANIKHWWNVIDRGHQVFGENPVTVSLGSQ